MVQTVYFVMSIITTSPPIRQAFCPPKQRVNIPPHTNSIFDEAVVEYQQLAMYLLLELTHNALEDALRNTGWKIHFQALLPLYNLTQEVFRPLYISGAGRVKI